MICQLLRYLYTSIWLLTRLAFFANHSLLQLSAILSGRDGLCELMSWAYEFLCKPVRDDWSTNQKKLVYSSQTVICNINSTQKITYAERIFHDLLFRLQRPETCYHFLCCTTAFLHTEFVCELIRHISNSSTHCAVYWVLALM